MTYRKKLIEVALPLDAINRESVRENYIYKGNPSAIHKWWSGKPLATSRAVILAQLVDDPSSCQEEFPTEADQEAERQRLFRIIEHLVKWENNNNEAVLHAAQVEIARSFAREKNVHLSRDLTPSEVADALQHHALPLLDPFSGGGSLPLEAQRLGLAVYASDLNPVAVLINKALIEIPPKFSGHPPINPDSNSSLIDHDWYGSQGLADDIRYYGKWMRDEAEKRIGKLYPKVKLSKEYGGDEVSVTAWLWMRTVICPNPACGIEMPLTNKFWLSTKKGKETWVEPIIDSYRKTINYQVRQGINAPEGTVNRQGAKCIACKSFVSLDYIRSEGRAGRMKTQIVAIVAEGSRGRIYISPNEEHSAIARQARPTWEPVQELQGKCKVNVPLYLMFRL
jgi:putative DNA methylase